MSERIKMLLVVVFGMVAVMGQQAVEVMTVEGDVGSEETRGIYGGVQTVCEYYEVRSGGRGYEVNVVVEAGTREDGLLGTAVKTGNYSGEITLYGVEAGMMRIVMVHELVHVFANEYGHAFVRGDVMSAELDEDAVMGGETMRRVVDVNANWTWHGGSGSRAPAETVHGRVWLFVVAFVSSFVYILMLQYCVRTRDRHEREGDFIDINRW